ncbi:penicillin-binding protein 2 [Pseudomonadota bacterium]
MAINEDYKKRKIFIKRAVYFISVLAFCIFLLILSLSYLQFIKYNEYTTRSESNRIRPFIIPPERGIIYDRNGIKLSANRDNYRVLLYKDQEYNEDKVINNIALILDLDEEDKFVIKSRIRRNYDKPIVSLVDNLNWGDLAKIEVSSYIMPGVATEKGRLRKYIFPDETAHLIGYVSIPSEVELKSEGENSKILLMHPDFRIGKNGLEKTYEKHLRGTPGLKYMEVNAYGIPIRRLSLEKGKKGQEIHLTIDIEIQKYITKRMKDLSGSVTVLNVNTGEILGMVSAPTFNPNSFVEKITSEQWEELINNSNKPLNNKAISELYPPGSTIKPVVALAALERGINPKSKINCFGRIWYGRRKFHCHKETGHGETDMIKAIQESCNIYFSKIGLKTGIDEISNMMKKFGLGQHYDIGLPYSSIGIVPNKEWKKEVLDDVWVRGDTINVSIGQGFMSVTPIELAVMTMRIANGGYPINPYLIKNEESKELNAKIMRDDPVVSAENIAVVHKGMYNVVNKRKGTAYWSRIKDKDFKMAGKTGTAQVIAKKAKEKMEESEQGLKNKFDNHGLFISFAPVQNPKYAVVVVVEHGGHGSVSAAPVARDILLKIRKLDLEREALISENNT